MSVHTYTIDYEVRDAQAVAALSRITAMLGAMNAQLNAINATLGNHATAGNQVVNTYNKFNQVIDNSTNVTKNFNKTLHDNSINIKEASDSARNFIVQLVAVHVAMKAIGFVVDIWKDGLAHLKAYRDYMEQLADDAFKFQSSLREIAAMKGATGVTTKITGEALNMAFVTGSDPEEMAALFQKGMGTARIGRIKGNLGKVGATEQQKDALQNEIFEEAAMFANKWKMDMGAAGTMGGQMTQFHKIESREDAAKVMGQMAFAAEVGSAEVGDIIKETMGLAGSLVDEGGQGMVRSLPDLARHLSLATLQFGSAAKAHTHVRQMYMKLSRKATQGGVTMDEEIARVHDEVVAQAERTGMEPANILAEMGYADTKSGTALLGAMKLIKESAQIKQGQAAITGEATMVGNRDAMKTEFGQQQAVRNRAKVGELQEGMRNDAFRTAMMAASSRLQAKGKLDGPGIAFRNALINGGGIAQFFGLPEASKAMIFWEAMNEAEAQAGKSGLGGSFATDKARMNTPVFGPGGQQPASAYDAGPKFFETWSKKLIAVGGSVYGHQEGVGEQARAMAGVAAVGAPGVGPMGGDPRAKPAELEKVGGNAGNGVAGDIGAIPILGSLLAATKEMLAGQKQQAIVNGPQAQFGGAVQPGRQ